MNPPRAKLPRAGRAGFTLMEVALAVTILSLVVTAVYSTWSAALTAWKRGTAVMESFQRERIVIETLEDLAKSAVFFSSRPDIYKVAGTSTPDMGSTISFVTASETLLPPSEAGCLGLRRVTIGLQRSRSGATYLALANAAAVQEARASEQPVWHVLSADVSGFGVRYRNPRDGTWQDQWEEVNALPSALMFTLAFHGTAAGLPPLVVTRAVELPSAQFVLESFGQVGARDTTNQVKRQDINLAEPRGGGAEEP